MGRIGPMRRTAADLSGSRTFRRGSDDQPATAGINARQRSQP
ncbi:hypothetical protein BIFDEN_00141 [Bifidobacterium dentium ATCC 27678]|nr:hypothetical protein BIFDEN_00141 [Bifidobacterium dentium ATCC 27678]BAQ26585.1 hypothetical protein BBDE_0591 [Bifidobacterium dentium JCM 1195 = DSM 20436]